jgi:hypothetical protein
MGEIILIHAPSEIGSGEKFDHVRQRRHAFVTILRKRSPIADVLFRPEEVHGASGIPDVIKPFPKGDGHIGQIFRSIVIENDAVTD